VFSDNPLVDLVIIASLFMLAVIVVYSIANYIVSSRLLKSYASHIRSTMDLPLVKAFVESHRRIRIEVGEDPSRGVVKVFWVTTRRYPYVMVDVDKSTAKVIKAFLIKNYDDELKYNPVEAKMRKRK
jgi:hypothetical protein